MKDDHDTPEATDGKDKEPVLFYEENGLIVFTEEYHLLRGYCCGSGCRHCPFGKDKGARIQDSGESNKE